MEVHDRFWMYKRLDEKYLLKQSFVVGVQQFISFAMQQEEFQGNFVIRCPCVECQNMKLYDIDTVSTHLYKKGFIHDYFQWVCHGERYPELRSQPTRTVVTNPYRDVVMDAMGSRFDHYNDEESQDLEEDPNLEVQKFFEMLMLTEKPLYKNSSMSLLEVAVQVIKLKCEYNLPHRCVDGIAPLLKNVIPDENLMSKNFYDTKKVLKALELPHQKIDACPKGCILFWKEKAELEHCSRCGRSRYKNTSKGKRVPARVLTYFPLTPRLQRIYATKNIVDKMRWHAENPRVTGKMSHPCDSPAWKHCCRDYGMANFECQRQQCEIEGSQKSLNEIFYDTVGGYEKNEVYGLGSSAELYFQKPSSRSRSSTSSSAYFPSEVSRLQKELEDKKKETDDLKKKYEDMSNYIGTQKPFLDQMLNNCCPFTSRTQPRDPSDDPSGGDALAFVA